MINRIVLIGRLVADPQLRYTQSGIGVVNFRIAVDRPFTNQQGEREADFIDVVAWRKLAETVAQNLNKGRLVGVDGRLQVREYEHEGQRRRHAEVVADTVQFLDWPAGQSGGGAQREFGGGSQRDFGSQRDYGSAPQRDYGGGFPRDYDGGSSGGGGDVGGGADFDPDDVPF